MNGRRLVLGLGLTSLALAGNAQSVRAQRVEADIHIGSFPVAGTIHIGDRYGYPRPRRVIWERDYPRRLEVRYDRDWRPWKHRDARMVVVYYDRDDDCYYEEYRRGLEEIRVYRDGDRFYRYDDDRYSRDGWYQRQDGRWERPWDWDRDRRWDREDRWRNRDRDYDRDRDRYRDRDRDRDDNRDRDHWQH